MDWLIGNTPDAAHDANGALTAANMSTTVTTAMNATIIVAT